MAKKLANPVVETPETSETEELNTLLAARVQKINGHTLSIEMAGERTLHIRNSSFDENVEKPFNFGDPNLCRAIVTAWLGIANGAYPILLPGLHAKFTLEALRANPTGLQEHVGYVRGGATLPEEWAKRFVEQPRQDDGWFEFEYVVGKFKISREMKDSHYVEGEFDSVTFQRNALYKQIALDILLSGASVNAHYFPSGAKYVGKVMESVDLPIAERINVAQQNTAAAIVRRTTRNIENYVAALEVKGEKFESGLRQVNLRTGKTLKDVDLIGKELLQWRGPVYLGYVAVTEKNLETFLSTVGKCRLSLALNDGSYDTMTGSLVK